MNYKGMRKDMTCYGGFKYEIGGEYEEPHAEACKCGFHACEYPLDVLSYYNPASSRFFEVEQSGVISKHGDDTKVASTKIKICREISFADLVNASVKYTMNHTVLDENSSATGDHGAASATGFQGAASATGFQGAASATGSQGAASATGSRGAASATGDYGVAMASGRNGKVMGTFGCAIFAVERNIEGKIIAAKAAIVDGIKIKSNVWYMLKAGEFVEV